MGVRLAMKYLIAFLSLVLALSLTACGQAASQTRSLSLDISDPPSVTSVANITPTIVAASGQVHLGQSKQIDGILVDDTYIYWTIGFMGDIYRYPMQGGMIDTVATTHYPAGSLDMLRPLRSDDWLVFMDVQRQTLSTPFMLRAHNLLNGTEQELVVSQAEDLQPPTFNVSGAWVVWTLLEKSKAANCPGGETVVAMQNLETQERRELDRACIDNNYLWNFNSPIGISSKHVVVDQMLPDAQGAGRRVYLFDLTAGTSISLTGDENGSFPALSEDWVAWKIMQDASDPGSNTMVLNLNTGKRIEVPTSLYSDEPFIANNRWLYWDDLGGNQHVIYDLTTGETFTVVTTTQKDTFTSAWHISGNTIVWSTIYVNPNQPDQKDVFVEWRTGADIKTVLTQMQQ